MTSTSSVNQNTLLYKLVYSKTKILFDRLIIGILGILLPIIVSIWAGVPLLGSISAYYHTLTGYWFVSILFIMGIILISYQGYHSNYNHSGVKTPEPGRDRLLSTIAGIGAIGLALFPTKIDSLPSTYQAFLRNWYQTLTNSSSIDIIRYLHYGFTLIFLGIMIWLTLEEFTKTAKENWIKVYRFSALIIFIGLVFLISSVLGIEIINQSLFWGEVISMYGVAMAWLFKFSTSVNKSRPFGIFFFILAIIGIIIMLIFS